MSSSSVAAQSARVLRGGGAPPAGGRVLLPWSVGGGVPAGVGTKVSLLSTTPCAVGPEDGMVFGKAGFATFFWFT